MNALLPRTLRKLGLLNHLNISSKTFLNGCAVRIPLLQEVGFMNLFSRDTWLLQLLETFFKLKEGCLIDAGANIGQSLILTKAADPDRSYLGFEPNPVCIAYCQQLIKENNFSNSMLIPVGLSNTTSLLVLDSYSESSVDSYASLIQNFRPKERVYSSQHVPVFPLDELADDLKIEAIAALKIDVEGAELEVLQGSVSSLEKHRPLVVLEMLPIYNEENHERYGRQKEILELSQKLNYFLMQIEKTDDNGIKSLQQIESVQIHGAEKSSDYVLVPSEHKDSLREFLSVAISN